MPVKHEADRGVCPTVSDDDRGLVLSDPESSEQVQDRCGLIVESLRRPLGIAPVETGQRHRCCPRAVGVQAVKDVIPRPRAEPVAGDEKDGGTARCSCHVTTLVGTTDTCMSLFVS